MLIPSARIVLLYKTTSVYIRDQVSTEVYDSWKFNDYPAKFMLEIVPEVANCEIDLDLEVTTKNTVSNII